MLVKRVAVCLVIAASLAACAVREPEPAAAMIPPPQPPPQPRIAPATFTQLGNASWYGGRFQHRQTASGERFDTNDWTAAHRSLPLQTIVRVTNLDNGRSVKVRINDRGPYGRGRVIDLSAQAARALDMKEDGIARVRLEVFDEDQAQSFASGL